MGALNEHLVPFVEDPPEANHITKNKESSSGAGINVLLIVVFIFSYKLC